MAVALLPPTAPGPLSQSAVGVPLRVLAIDAALADADRLKAMGICLGRKIMLLRAGRNVVIRVMGTRVGVAARLAEQVLVEPIDCCELGSP